MESRVLLNLRHTVQQQLRFGPTGSGSRVLLGSEKLYHRRINCTSRGRLWPGAGGCGRRPLGPQSDGGGHLPERMPPQQPGQARLLPHGGAPGWRRRQLGGGERPGDPALLPARNVPLKADELPPAAPGSCSRRRLAGRWSNCNCSQETAHLLERGKESNAVGFLPAM